MRALFLSTIFLLGSPAAAATLVGTAHLGSLGTAFGTGAFPEAQSYTPADEQIYRFAFTVPTTGQLTVSLGYQTEVRSQLQTVCPDPEDTSSCYVEPDGDYRDYSGVNLVRFALTPGPTAALPGGFQDILFGGPGQGYQTYGFNWVETRYELERTFTIGPGSYVADLGGFGIIRDPAFAGTGGGDFLYTFSFASNVPEPVTWGLMIGGFGMVGCTLRATRRRRIPRPAA